MKHFSVCRSVCHTNVCTRFTDAPLVFVCARACALAIVWTHPRVLRLNPVITARPPRRISTLTHIAHEPRAVNRAVVRARVRVCVCVRTSIDRRDIETAAGASKKVSERSSVSSSWRTRKLLSAVRLEFARACGSSASHVFFFSFSPAAASPREEILSGGGEEVAKSRAPHPTVHKACRSAIKRRPP